MGQKVFFEVLFEMTVDYEEFLVGVTVVYSLRNDDHEVVLWDQTDYLAINVDNWEAVMGRLKCFKNVFDCLY